MGKCHAGKSPTGADPRRHLPAVAWSLEASYYVIHGLGVSTLRYATRALRRIGLT